MARTVVVAFSVSGPVYRWEAGVGRLIRFEEADATKRDLPADKGVLVCNPPYGERMLELKEARELYRIAGERFLKKPYHSYTIISPDDRFEECFGRPADKRRKLYNGTLKCQVYMYFR
jgi:putative N6-adenine-specific DNA methylase